jgi:FolB domain-containing protein
MDFIHIDGLLLDCIVGVRPFERRRPQPVRLDIGLGLSLSEAGRTGRIGHTCDYDRVADEVRTLLRFRAYRLLEVAAEELSAMLFAAHPALEQVRIRLDKPTALHGRARSAGVEVTRHRDEFPTRRTPRAFGEVEALLETDEAGLYLVHVEPGRAIDFELPPGVSVMQWLVEGELTCGGQRCWVGEPMGLPRSGCVTNAVSGERGAVLFWCTCPAWLPE